MGGWVYPSSTCLRWQVRPPRSSRWPATSVPERRLIAPHSLGARGRSSRRRWIGRAGARSRDTATRWLLRRGEVGRVRVRLAQRCGAPGL
jgi:hypothetical protein